MSGAITLLDEALQRVSQLRDELLADIGTEHRAERLAALFESEARIWSQLFELSAHRLVWRAALAAEERARAHAREWWRRAVDEAAPEVLIPVAGTALPRVDVAVEV